MAYRVVWSDSALERVTELLDFITEENPAAARRVAQELFSRVQALIEHPRLGRPLRDEMEPDLRRLVVGDYIVVYRVQEMLETISIAAVRHHRQRSLRGEDG